MQNTYTVISFGNYETKILICNFIEDKIYPVYKKSFLTKSCYKNSEIIDKELLVKTLVDEFKKIPININKTKIIFNLPIKKLNIVENHTSDIVINSTLTQKRWNYILNHNIESKSNSKQIELDYKCFSTIADGSTKCWPAPINKPVEKIRCLTKHYLVDRLIIKEYLSIAKELKINLSLLTCDSLIMNHLFSNPERRFKVLLNIGHGESSFELYDNSVLIHQATIKFAIKDLTSKICEFANIDEVTSIELLKKYRDLVPIDMDLPLVNHFKEKYLDYSQTKIADINALIKLWMKKLISYINEYMEKSLSGRIDVSEIYIYSSTNFFKTWTNYIKKNLNKFADIICLEPNYIGIDESKFISLVTTMIHFQKESNYNK